MPPIKHDITTTQPTWTPPTIKLTAENNKFAQEVVSNAPFGQFRRQQNPGDIYMVGPDFRQEYLI